MACDLHCSAAQRISTKTGWSMERERHSASVRESGQSLASGVRLGRIAGIELAFDWSLGIIFLLITVSLAVAVFPRWHPGWGFVTSWVVAVVAAALFFVSVLLHELAHSLVARAYGVPVRRITLFIFGGMAHMSDEPPSAGAEFLIALVGPLTSILIGIVALAGGSFLLPSPAAAVAEEPARALQMAGPLATLLLWLGPVNLILGVFNLVPGFPLDGGRLLRAVLWSITGELLKATRWAAGVGRGFAWLLMGLGVAMALGLRVPVLGSGFVSGIWLVLIGWFLSNAAQMSYQQVLHRDVLRGVPVTRLMYARVDRVPPDLSVQALVEEGILHSDQRAFPVVEDERLVGLVCLDDVRRVPRDRWADRTVSEIMTPADRLATVGPQDDALHAMKVLSEREVNQVPVVVEDGRVVGVVRRQDIVKWLTLLRPLEA